jgi:hypothetical protein
MFGKDTFNVSKKEPGGNAALEHNIFFEGGDREIVVELEGGSDEEADGGVALTEGVDGAAETIKSKRSKKKKKKGNGMRSSRRSSMSRNKSEGALSEGKFILAIILFNIADVKEGTEMVEDLNETMKSARSAKSGKSGKSVGKKGKKKKKGGARSTARSHKS